jgi:undecaprenyl-diphosphatase
MQASQLPIEIPRVELADSRRKAVVRRRRRWGRKAALASIALGAVGGFLAISRTIGWDRTNEVDRVVVQGLGRLRAPVLDAVSRAVTFLGSVSGVTLLSLASLYVMRKKPRSLFQVAAGAAGGIIAELWVKGFFDRSRPTLLVHLEDVQSTSFPSGHSMAAASFYLSLAFVLSRNRVRHRTALVVGGSAIAAAVGASRVYLGVHWPTDVLGGLALGTAWASGVEAVFDFEKAHELEQENSPPSLSKEQSSESSQ